MDEVMFFLMALLTALGIWLGPTLIVGLVAFSLHRRLSWRVLALEHALESLEATETPAPPADEPVPVPVPVPVPDLDEAPDPEPAPEPEPAPTPEPDPTPPWTGLSPERLVVWVAATLGGLALVIAALLAIVVVIERGWIAPSTRVALGLLSGVALWATGAWLRTRAPWPSSALSGAGVSTLYGALWGASGLYHLVPSEVAGLGMAGVTAVAMVRAAKLNDRFVAHLGLLGGLLTPILVSSGSNDALGMFAYLAVLTAGVAALSARTGWWHTLAVVAVGDVALHTMWTASAYTPEQAGVALLGAGAMALPLAVASGQRDVPVRIAGTVGAIAVSALALPWLVPIDPVFVDPRTHERLVRPNTWHAVQALVAVLALPIPLWAAGRWRGGWHAASGTLVSVVGLLAFAFGWGGAALVETATPALVAVGIIAATACGSVVAWDREKVARTLLPLAAVWGLALSVALPSLDGGLAALVVTASAVVAASIVRSARTGLGMWVWAAGAWFALWSMGLQVERLEPGWVAGAALVVLALAPWAVWTRWTTLPESAWAAVAAVALLVFPPLHAAWDLALGDTVIGLLPVGLSAVVLAATASLLKRRRLDLDDTATAVLVGTTLLGVAAAVPLQLQTTWWTVAWALEAAALAAVSRRVRHPLVGIAALVLCGAVGVRLVLNPHALAWGDAAGLPIFNWTLYAWGVPLLCVLAVAKWLPRDDVARAIERFAWARAPLGGLAIAIGFALVNVQVSHAFQDAGPLELGSLGRAVDMVRSISWAAYGIGILGIGLWRDERWVRLAGFAVVLLATGKVFAVDLWDLAGFVRVASVGGLAVALLIAAFVFERLVLRGSRIVENT